MGGDRYAYRAGYGPGELPSRYAPLEMYLAGFFAPEDVPSFWNAPLAERVRTEDGEIATTPNGEWMFDAYGKTTHTIEDLISVYGPRVPDTSEAQWHFRAAAIVIGDDYGPVTDDHLKAVSEFLEGYSSRTIDEDANVGGRYRVSFYEMTDGRGSITFDGLSQFRKSIPAAPVDLPASFGTPPSIQYCEVPPVHLRAQTPRP